MGIFMNYCHACYKKASVIHHIDRNRKNNISSNLVALCYHCHAQIHGQNKIGQTLFEEFKKYRKSWYVNRDKRLHQQALKSNKPLPRRKKIASRYYNTNVSLH
jgi:hypothetical protein